VATLSVPQADLRFKGLRNIILSRKPISEQARREGEVGGKLLRAPRRLGTPPSARNIKYDIMYHFQKKSKFSPQRGSVKMFGGPTRMFPRARLWLSTGLSQSYEELPYKITSTTTYASFFLAKTWDKNYEIMLLFVTLKQCCDFI